MDGKSANGGTFSVNQEFLLALVGGEAGVAVMRQMGWVIPIGQPTGEGSWPAYGWQGGPIPRGRSHWSPILVHGTEGSKVSRRASEVVAALALVIDDAGGGSVWGLPEFARIETSPNNFQIVVGLSEPVPRGYGAEISTALRMAVKAAGGIADPSGNNVERWARLPALDAPLGKVHPAKLVSMPMETIHPLDLLLELSSRVPEKERGLIEWGDGVTVLTDVESDPLWRWMKAHGWLNGKRNGEAWVCKCPWGHEHTPGPDGVADWFSGCRYFPAAGGGSFKCWRGNEHLVERAKAEGAGSVTRLVRRYLAGLGAPDPDAMIGDNKATAHLVGASLDALLCSTSYLPPKDDVWKLPPEWAAMTGKGN